MTDELVAFVRQRLDEDEQMWGDMLGSGAELTLVEHYFRDGVPELLKRVLAEVEAKRRILALHYPIDPCDAHDAAQETIPCDTLLALAQPYAGREGWREEWRVDQR